MIQRGSLNVLWREIPSAVLLWVRAPTQRQTSAPVRTLSWLGGVFVVCFQAVRTKLPHTSYKQPHNPVNTIVWLVWQSSKQNGKSTSYPFLKNLCVQKLASFPFPDFFFLLRFLRTFQFSFDLFGETAVVSYVFLSNFSREVGMRLAETVPLAHAQRLTVVYELTGCVLCVTCNLIYCDTGNMITMFLTYS